MKTFSRPSTILGVIVLAFISVLALRVYAKKATWKDAPYVLKIQKVRKFKDPSMTAQKFEQLLKDNEAIYCIKVRKDDGSETSLTENDCTGPVLSNSTSVDNATRDLMLICGGAHVTQVAGFNTPQQQTNVDNTMYPP